MTIEQLISELLTKKIGGFLNLTGHDINVEATGGGIVTFETAKDDKGNTWSLRVISDLPYLNREVSIKNQDIALYSRSTSRGKLSLYCKETKEEVEFPFGDTTYRFPVLLDGKCTPIVSAIASTPFASGTVVVPMTAPNENPTRNDKGWIISVKGLRFNS
jgi:hypothetical protein